MPGRFRWLQVGSSFLLACLLGGFASSADARTRLEDEDNDRDARLAETRRARDEDRQDRRDRDVDEDDQREARRSTRDSEWFRDPGYYGYGNFPSMEVHDAVVANARAATARAIFRRAENVLNSAVRKAVRTFEGSTELREARKAEKDAYESYATARRRALQSVLEDPKYRALMSLHQELSDQISFKRANRAVVERTDKEFMEDIMSMATLKVNYASDARAMEQMALAGSTEAKDAEAKLRQAATKASEMKKDFDNALRNDRDLLAARATLEDARIARLTASAYLNGAERAADEALDFARYLNRYSRYNGVGYQDYREYNPYSSRDRLIGY